jgi:hypothetical protein
MEYLLQSVGIVVNMPLCRAVLLHYSLPHTPKRPVQGPGHKADNNKNHKRLCPPSLTFSSPHSSSSSLAGL